MSDPYRSWGALAKDGGVGVLADELERVVAQRDAVLAAARAVLVAWWAGDWDDRGATSRFRAALLALDDAVSPAEEAEEGDDDGPPNRTDA